SFQKVQFLVDFSSAAFRTSATLEEGMAHPTRVRAPALPAQSNPGGGLGGGRNVRPLRTEPYGQTRVMNFSGGGPPHCEISASSGERSFPPFFALRRSVSAQCSCTRPHGSAQ